MNTLLIIPARAGSKGLPQKNIKKLGTKPLIYHTIDFALLIKKEQDTICVTTNDPFVKDLIKVYSNVILIDRPEYLSEDNTSMHDVLIHTLNCFKQFNCLFERVLLLQPTSPIRNAEDYYKMESIYDANCDMVVTVKESKANPYFNLFEENKDGFLSKSKHSNFVTRQSCPKIYEYNGSMYLIRTLSLESTNMHQIERVKKHILSAERSIDIDEMKDWILAEHYYYKNNPNG
jgi:N-acylneuraminate cytidylyltransferase